MPEQVTMRELLRDPVFRKWMGKIPQLKVRGGITDPWRIYAREEPQGRWTQIDFPKYSEAYKFLASNIRNYHDMALNCKRQPFKPPVVKVADRRRYHIPIPPSDADVAKDSHRHIWCPYCRRPTLFLWYKKHHAMRLSVVSPNDRRCSICGVRLSFIPRYEGRR